MELKGACCVLCYYYIFSVFIATEKSNTRHLLEIWSLHSADDREMWLQLQRWYSGELTLEKICTDSSRRHIYKKNKRSTWCFRPDGCNSASQHGCQSGAPTPAVIFLSYFWGVWRKLPTENSFGSSQHGASRRLLTEPVQAGASFPGGSWWERVWAARNSEHKLVFTYLYLKRGESSLLQESMTQSGFSGWRR